MPLCGGTYLCGKSRRCNCSNEMTIVASRSRCEYIIFIFFQVFGLFPFYVSADGLRVGRMLLLWSLCVLLTTYSAVGALYYRRMEFRISSVFTLSTIVLHAMLAAGAAISLTRVYLFRIELNNIITSVRSAHGFSGLPTARYGRLVATICFLITILVYCETLHFVYEEMVYIKISHSIFSVYIVIGISISHQIVWFLCRITDCYAKINMIWNRPDTIRTTSRDVSL